MHGGNVSSRSLSVEIVMVVKEGRNPEMFARYFSESRAAEDSKGGGEEASQVSILLHYFAGIRWDI